MREDERMHNENQYDKDMGEAMDWSAFIAGGLIGAGFALLFAHERGTELRSKLRDYADRAKDELMEQGREVWDTAVKRVKEYSDKGEEVVRNAGRSQGNFPNRDSRRTGQSIKYFV
jgi:gas vesicle protein